MAIAAALAAVWLMGALLLSLAALRGRGGAGTDFAAGAALLAAYGTVSVIAGIPLWTGAPYVLAALLAGGCAASGRWPDLRWRAVRDPVVLLLLAAAVAVLVPLAVDAARDRLWWDGWAMWMFKARMLFVDGGYSPALRDASSIYRSVKPEYPLAVPMLDWWLFRHLGATVPAAASLAGAAWTAALASLAWSAVRERAGDRMGAAAALGTAAFWPVSSFAIGGTADVAIALALLGAAAELVRMARGERDAAWRLAVFCTLAALAKNEGLVVAGAAGLLGCGVLARAGVREPRRYLPLALPALPIGAWMLFVRATGLPPASAVVAPSGPLAPRAAALGHALAGMLADGSWLPVALLAGVAAAAGIRRRRWMPGAPWLLVATYVGAVCAVYVLAAADMRWLVGTSLERVLGPVAPTVVFLALGAVGRGPLGEEAAG